MFGQHCHNMDVKGYETGKGKISGWCCLLRINCTHFLLPVVGLLLDKRYHSALARFEPRITFYRIVALRSFLLRWFRSRWLGYSLVIELAITKGKSRGHLFVPTPIERTCPGNQVLTADTQLPGRLMLFPSALPSAIILITHLAKAILQQSIYLICACDWTNPIELKCHVAKLLGIPIKPLFNNKTIGPSHFSSEE